MTFRRRFQGGRFFLFFHKTLNYTPFLRSLFEEGHEKKGNTEMGTKHLFLQRSSTLCASEQRRLNALEEEEEEKKIREEIPPTLCVWDQKVHASFVFGANNLNAIV